MKAEAVDILSGDVKREAPQAAQTINTNIDITSAVANGERLSVDFEYRVTYQPDQSRIVLKGKAVFSGKEAGSSAAEWGQSGRIGGEAGEFVLNAINYGASINALMLARIFNLP